REELLLAPTAAQGLYELHRGGEALAGELGAAALGLQCFPARVHHFEVAYDTRAITIGREFGGAAGIRHGAVLRGGLVTEMSNARETVLHVAECDEDALAIIGDALFVS